MEMDPKELYEILEGIALFHEEEYYLWTIIAEDGEIHIVNTERDDKDSDD